ncbi:glycosyltransferase family 2 protein [Aeoliella sp. SH292]|uniref:glycosyltransferase family 2 protein n=1 Tax=Aeoliella sp. SH292 TaxID=3454464 RepID=UPI003F97DD95
MSQLLFSFPETPGLVSVIIPTRNGVRFLGEALDSISSQIYKHWEVVVVEDGSNDGAEQLVEQFARNHPRHRVHYQRNETSCGAAYTRNVAFQQAAGQYIAFLDCDDRWLPYHMQSCVAALEESGDDLAYSTVVMFTDGTDLLLGLWGPTAPEVASFPESLFGRSYVTPSATIVRRSVIEEVGPWDARRKYCEDADFMLRAAYIGKKFRYVGGVHCLYRKCHAGATTQSLAGTIEESTDIAQLYTSMPGLRPRRLKRLIAVNVAVAARFHATSHPAHDPSATRGRAAPLYFRAWKLDRKRWKDLFKAAFCAVRFGIAATHQPLDRPSLPVQSGLASSSTATRSTAANKAA